MSVDTASVGAPVAPDVANQAPILDMAAPTLGPALNFTPVEGLPPELQPQPGDILLSRAFWPWDDLGAKGIPESWLYMSRHVQGTIAMLSVQTSAGPKLVKANPDGTIVQAVAAQSRVTPMYAYGTVPNPQLVPQMQYIKFTWIDNAALLVNSNTVLVASGGASSVFIKRLRVSSNVAAVHTVRLTRGAGGLVYASVILPASAAPYDFVFDDAGAEFDPTQDVDFFTDAAGVFAVSGEYTS